MAQANSDMEMFVKQCSEELSQTLQRVEALRANVARIVKCVAEWDATVLDPLTTQRLSELSESNIVEVLDALQQRMKALAVQAANPVVTNMGLTNSRSSMGTAAISEEVQTGPDYDESAHQIATLVGDVYKLVDFLYRRISTEQLKPQERAEVKRTYDLLTSRDGGRLQDVLRLLTSKDSRIKELQEQTASLSALNRQRMHFGAIGAVEVHHICNTLDCQEYRSAALAMQEQFDEESTMARKAHDELREKIQTYENMIVGQNQKHEAFIRLQTALMLGESWQCPFCNAPGEISWT